MLVYRVLDEKKYIGSNEIDAYLKECLTPNGPSRRNVSSGINTFDYKYNPYCHHFFLFSEDAIKFLKALKTISSLKIGEFELDDKLFLKYSGFGIYNSFSYMFGPAIEVCIPQTDDNRTYPYKSNIIDNFDELSDEEYLRIMEQEHYFMFHGMKTTGQLFSLNDSKITSTYREKIYKLYCKKIWCEFIKEYGVIYDKNEKKFKNFTEFTDDEEILEKREKVLRKYEILK